MDGINLKEGLKKYFGFDQFKGNQQEIIESILAGQDTFVLMPTGGGKSLCYQLPALLQPGTAVIISPLIALMKNQVDAVRGFCAEDTVAHVLNSTLSRSQLEEVKQDVRQGRTNPYTKRKTLSSCKRYLSHSMRSTRHTVYQSGDMTSDLSIVAYAPSSWRLQSDPSWLLRPRQPRRCSMTS